MEFIPPCSSSAAEWGPKVKIGHKHQDSPGGITDKPAKVSLDLAAGGGPTSHSPLTDTRC